MRPDARRVIAAAAIIAALGWLIVLWPHDRGLSVTFVDVGQGDCTVIRTPSGRTVLIDGGGVPENGGHFDVGSSIVVPALRREGINTIDLMVATHPHEDHVSGLLSVLRQLRVRRVLDPGIPDAAPVYQDFLRQVEKSGARYYRGRKGTRIIVDRSVSIEVLNPPSRLPPSEDINDLSAALMMRYGKLSFLFAADCQAEAEARICGSFRDIRATVLKVGHHGSSRASSEEWLRRVHPSIAVISVGRHNFFNHPSDAALRRLRAAGCRVYRTDIDGAVRVWTDGKRLIVKPTRSRIPR